VRWSAPLGDNSGELSLEGGFSPQSEVAAAVDNLVDATGRACPGTLQPSYTQFGAMAEWSNAFGEDGLTLARWGKNLTNEEFDLFSICVYNTAFGSTFSFFGEPRTAGLDLTFRF
jgi:hypothetical protein